MRGRESTDAVRVAHLCVCVCMRVSVWVCGMPGDVSGIVSGDKSGDISGLDTSFTMLNYADTQSRDEVSAARVWRGVGWWVGGLCGWVGGWVDEW